jgi:hypothetical protein
MVKVCPLQMLSVLPRRIVPLSPDAKLMSVLWPAGVLALCVIAARNEPAPLSVRFSTVMVVVCACAGGAAGIKVTVMVTTTNTARSVQRRTHFETSTNLSETIKTLSSLELDGRESNRGRRNKQWKRKEKNVKSV